LEAPVSNPRIRVAAVIPDEEGLVLVRHRKNGEIYDLLPGGGVEPGETLEAALKREVLEETGLTCDVGHPLFINDSIAPDGSRHVVQITFLATRTGGEIDMDPSDERVLAAHFVPVSLLAYLDLRPPMAQQLLAAATTGYPATTRYLGALWTDDASGITETEQHP
jgi:ADP-ribose pyrophosphatase YjhB (NUDIX family)